jgi:1-deoxy-D-xylulose-5-phosphate synthase
MTTLETTVLENINCPSDVKKLSLEQLNVLSDEIRKGILNRVDKVGGHLGPDLGIVEATIALHYVFNSPVDKLVFDVSHQCYPHKMLTGRKEGFLNPTEHPEISGYSNQNESEHDHFMIGHTSTSVSLAAGLAKARDLKGENYNVIALIGDGSLSGGEAFEGLNNSSVLNSNFIVIVNDNEMSIAQNQGGLYKNLQLLRETNGQCENNWFKAFGFDYIYVEEGNNVEKLIEAFNKVKDTDHPVVVHIHTLKGKGYEPAVNNKEWGHWSMPGLLSQNSSSNGTVPECYETITKDYILNKVKEDKSVIAVNAATPGVFWWDEEFRNKLGKNYTDVGIAEQHAVGYSSGLATGGAKPIFGVMTSFIQRAYDQLSQDLALNNSPATILVYWGGISSADCTHLGLFDIPLICNIPNIVYLAPTCKEEYLKMLDWSVEQTDYSVAIRVPTWNYVSTGVEDTTDYSILNKYSLVSRGSKVAILGLGDLFELGKSVKEELKSRLGIDATLINPKFITGVDEELLNSLKSDHDVVITLENGTLDGGFGEKISRFYGNSNVKVLNYGADKEFNDRVPMDELLTRYHLKKEMIVDDIASII